MLIIACSRTDFNIINFGAVRFISTAIGGHASFMIEYAVFFSLFGFFVFDRIFEAFDAARYEFIYEVADVWFHSLIGLAWFDIESKAVLDELGRRFGLSGIDEKNAR